MKKENEYKIRGIMLNDSEKKEIVSIPVLEFDFFEFVERIEKSRLSDKILQVDEFDIKVVINNDSVLGEIHSKANNVNDLITYLHAYALSLENN